MVKEAKKICELFFNLNQTWPIEPTPAGFGPGFRVFYIFTIITNVPH